MSFDSAVKSSLFSSSTYSSSQLENSVPLSELVAVQNTFPSPSIKARDEKEFASQLNPNAINLAKAPSKNSLLKYKIIEIDEFASISCKSKMDGIFTQHINVSIVVLMRGNAKGKVVNVGMAHWNGLNTDDSFFSKLIEKINKQSVEEIEFFLIGDVRSTNFSHLKEEIESAEVIQKIPLRARATLFNSEHALCAGISKMGIIFAYNEPKAPRTTHPRRKTLEMIWQ